MALKPLSFLVVLALSAFSSLAGVSTAFGSRKTLAVAPAPDNDDAIIVSGGLAPLPADLGFTPLDRHDPKVIDLAKYATSEFNKVNNTKLVFSAVLEAISSPTTQQETNYELAILATEGKQENFYSVKLSVANNVKKLISFY